MVTKRKRTQRPGIWESQRRGKPQLQGTQGCHLPKLVPGSLTIRLTIFPLMNATPLPSYSGAGAAAAQLQSVILEMVVGGEEGGRAMTMLSSHLLKALSKTAYSPYPSGWC